MRSILPYTQRTGIAKVAEQLASFPNVRYVIVTTGRYDIFAWAVFRNSEEMSNFVRAELGSISGIISHETVMSLRIAKGSFKLAMDDGKA